MVTVGVMDLEVCDMSATGDTIAILQLTIPRDVVRIYHLLRLSGKIYLSHPAHIVQVFTQASLYRCGR